MGFSRDVVGERKPLTPKDLDEGSGDHFHPNHFLKMSLELWDHSFPVSLRPSGTMPPSPSVSEGGRIWKSTGLSVSSGHSPHQHRMGERLWP